MVWDSTLNGGVGGWSPLSVEALQKPTENYLFAEAVGWWHNSLRGSRGTMERRTNRYNVLAPDGHVKSYTDDQFWVFALSARSSW
jgi:hypothetical protein